MNHEIVQLEASQIQAASEVLGDAFKDNPVFRNFAFQNDQRILSAIQLEDELRPEYDLKSLWARRLGARQKDFGGVIIRLEPDVAEMLPSADAVNEALRFLVRVTQERQGSVLKQQSNQSAGAG
jgi:hypothetical protein